MTQFRVELVGGPVPQKGTINVPNPEPPQEVPIEISRGPEIRTEETDPMPGVVTFAIYVLHEIDDEGTAIYAYSNERTVH